MFILVLFLFSFAYFLLILRFNIGFDKCEQIENQHKEAQESFSIVVPFRNEKHNLPILLASFTKLNYPKSKYEIIFIDDDSEDNSKNVIEAWRAKKPKIKTSILNNKRLTNSPKKDALTLAISKSNYPWIVTTDADCKILENWLTMFNQIIISKQPYFIAAPVKFTKENSFLFEFQNLNFLALIGSTIGAFGFNKPFICNGANLCYSKEVFNEVNGFEGNSKIASGDDVFLLEKIIKNNSEKAIYLKSKDAIIETKSEPNWNSFIQQQLRWASKTGNYTNWFSKGIGFIVFLQNLLLVIGMISALFNTNYFKYVFIVFLLKLVIDFILIKKTVQFVESKINMLNYIFSSLIYPFFVSYIALISSFKNYEWKGRVFKS